MILNIFSNFKERNSKILLESLILREKKLRVYFHFDTVVSFMKVTPLLFMSILSCERIFSL